MGPPAEAVRVPDGAHDRVRWRRQPVARHRGTRDDARLGGPARRVQGGPRQRHDRHDDRRRARRPRRRSDGPPLRAHRQRPHLRRPDRRGGARREPVGPRHPALSRRARTRRRDAQRGGARLRVRAPTIPPVRDHPDDRLRPARRHARGSRRRAVAAALRMARLFALGGTLPLVAVAVLMRFLPESPRYLARHPERWPELERLLRQIGHTIPAGSTLLSTSARPPPRARRSARSLPRTSAATPSRSGARCSPACWPFTRPSTGCRRCSRAPGSGCRSPAMASPRSISAASPEPSAADW